MHTTSPFPPIADYAFLSNHAVERLLRIAPLGLYTEELEVDRAGHLGNFPQGFSHLALTEGAGRIILADRLQEWTG